MKLYITRPLGLIFCDIMSQIHTTCAFWESNTAVCKDRFNKLLLLFEATVDEETQPFTSFAIPIYPHYQFLSLIHGIISFFIQTALAHIIHPGIVGVSILFKEGIRLKTCIQPSFQHARTAQQIAKQRTIASLLRIAAEDLEGIARQSERSFSPFSSR